VIDEDSEAQEAASDGAQIGGGADCKRSGELDEERSTEED